MRFEPSWEAPPPIPFMAKPNTICVYCGSGLGSRPGLRRGGPHVRTQLAESGIGLVYGGGSLGLMGELARSVLDHGGQVTGIIPEFLIDARAHARGRRRA